MTTTEQPSRYWCNVHQRSATGWDWVNNRACCERGLGGIMLPCQVVLMDGWTLVEDE